MMKKWLTISIIVLIFNACVEEEKGEVEWGSGVCYFEELDTDFKSCLSPNNETTLEIVSWNLKTFPLLGPATLDLAAEVIVNMNVDLVAIQEMTDRKSFNKLVDKMPGWHGEYVDIMGDLDLAFLYKICEITSVEGPEIIADSIWPRPGIETTLTHTNGMVVTLINIHLKCCGGEDNRSARQSASEILKNHIDMEHDRDQVLLLGDFNDQIVSDSPFENFIEDSENFKFADMSIANGPDTDWSYPSYPSHIDHILISNELFDTVIDTQVLNLGNCITDYATYLSDHKPLMIRLSPW